MHALQVSTAEFNISTLCYDMGHASQASDHANNCMQIRKSNFGAKHPLYAEALVNYGAIQLVLSETASRARREAVRMIQVCMCL
jgi:hypothetical protein